MTRQKFKVNGSYPERENDTFRSLKQQFPVYGPLPIWILVVIYSGMVLLFLLSYASLLSFPTPLLEVDQVSHLLFDNYQLLSVLEMTRKYKKNS